MLPSVLKISYLISLYLFTKKTENGPETQYGPPSHFPCPDLNECILLHEKLYYQSFEALIQQELRDLTMFYATIGPVYVREYNDTKFLDASRYPFFSIQTKLPNFYIRSEGKMSLVFNDDKNSFANNSKPACNSPEKQ